MGINLLEDEENSKPVNLLADDQESEANEPEEQFLPPKKEGIETWLPRDIMIGLLNQRQNVINQPHDIAQNLEQQGQEFGQSVNKTLPMEKYFENKKSPTGNNKPYKNISEYLPHEQNDFAKLMGQEGAPSTSSWLIQKGIEHAPELYGISSLLRHLPVTAKGIMKKLSKNKSEVLNEAKSDYSNLFKEASNEGLNFAIPLNIVKNNAKEIVKNSIPKYHTSLTKYMDHPSIENAHWAQSELGALERHLDKISQKTGLTPSQVTTYKAVKKAREGIKKSMFSENAFGANTKLAEKYNKLSNKYRENVIPYTRLEDLMEFESGKLRPKTAVKNLLNDEEFMINLSKKYPGIFLHTPTANKLKWGGAGLLGYDEFKKILG